MAKILAAVVVAVFVLSAMPVSPAMAGGHHHHHHHHHHKKHKTT